LDLFGEAESALVNEDEDGGGDARPLFNQDLVQHGLLLLEELGHLQGSISGDSLEVGETADDIEHFLSFLLPVLIHDHVVARWV